MDEQTMTNARTGWRAWVPADGIHGAPAGQQAGRRQCHAQAGQGHPGAPLGLRVRYHVRVHSLLLVMKI